MTFRPLRVSPVARGPTPIGEAADLREHGVDAEYVDYAGALRRIGAADLERVKALVGDPGGDESAVGARVMMPGDRLDARGELRLERGGTVSVDEGTRRSCAAF
jgi:hypothetical protein